MSITLLALLALGSALGASTFLALSPRELVRDAEAVVQGRVVGLESFWNEDGRIIVTEATVAVDEVIVGDAPPTVRVRTFGGQVGDVLVEAPGFPAFEQNERVILFLNTDADDGTTRVLGYQQGQFRVVTRLDGVTLAVPQVDDDARLLDASGRPARQPQSVEIGQFKSALRQLARREGRLAR